MHTHIHTYTYTHTLESLFVLFFTRKVNTVKNSPHRKMMKPLENMFPPLQLV